MLYSRTVLNQFRIGDIFERIFPEETKVGWIVGLTLNGLGEVVFQVKYADNPDEIWLCHPEEMRNIVDRYPGVKMW